MHSLQGIENHANAPAAARGPPMAAGKGAGSLGALQANKSPSKAGTGENAPPPPAPQLEDSWAAF